MCTVAQKGVGDFTLTLASKGKATKQRLPTEWPFPDCILLLELENDICKGALMSAADNCSASQRDWN